MLFLPADTQKKLIWETCLPAGSCSTSHTPAMLSSADQDQALQHLQRVHTSSGTSCPAKEFHMTTSTPAQTGNTEFLPISLLALRNILYFLFSFLFTWPRTSLASAWLWDLYVVTDCMAVICWYVTTVCHNTNSPISSLSQILQETNLGDVYCFVKFSDQQVWKLCGWQNTDVHPHKLLLWSQEMT